MSQIDKFRDTVTDITTMAAQSLIDAGIRESVGFILIAVDHTNNPTNRVVAFSDLCEQDVEAVLRSVLSQSDGIGAVMGNA